MTEQEIRSAWPDGKNGSAMNVICVNCGKRFANHYGGHERSTHPDATKQAWLCERRTLRNLKLPIHTTSGSVRWFIDPAHVGKSIPTIIPVGSNPIQNKSVDEKPNDIYFFSKVRDGYCPCNIARQQCNYHKV